MADSGTARAGAWRPWIRLTRASWLCSRRRGGGWSRLTQTDRVRFSAPKTRPLRTTVPSATKVGSAVRRTRAFWPRRTRASSDSATWAWMSACSRSWTSNSPSSGLTEGPVELHHQAGDRGPHGQGLDERLLPLQLAQLPPGQAEQLQLAPEALALVPQGGHLALDLPGRAGRQAPPCPADPGQGGL